MAISEAERKRRQDELDAEPWYFGIPWGVFRQMPVLEQNHIRQKVAQFGATKVGFWKDCSLAKCRRAKRCCGFLSDAQRKQGYNPAYPPCARGEEPRRARIYFEGIRPYGDEAEQVPKYAGRASDRGEGE
ncbi:hypothetical protein [Neorhizobium alkalisoli]|uniref:Uncharacterized protein n=1 Tax=Neorhizobium alkalisoli TaxID=528178 RepID=A0A561QS38_9HYPH|nr:hypothetical protein [Neorhizobium alkalisoli]TWF53215.1 hypothetical protein FHW37_104490 [Neorhizobium alkalisoli]